MDTDDVLETIRKWESYGAQVNQALKSLLIQEPGYARHIDKFIETASSSFVDGITGLSVEITDEGKKIVTSVSGEVQVEDDAELPGFGIEGGEYTRREMTFSNEIILEAVPYATAGPAIR